MKKLLFILVLSVFMFGCVQDTFDIEVHLKAQAKQPKSEANVVEIDLESFKWGFDPEVIKVKKGDIVRIHAITREMLHGIAIEGYEVDDRLLLSDMTTIEFVADKQGAFEFFCTDYCGEGIANIRGTLIVE